MIDWKREAIGLATIVIRYNKMKFHSDMKLAEKMAKELIKLGKEEDKKNALRN